MKIGNLVPLMLLLGTSSAMACDCEIPSAAILRETGRDVFIGVVLNDNKTSQIPVARIRVERAFKGADAKVITVRSTESDCFVHLKQGQRFIVTTRPVGENAVLEVDQCTTISDQSSHFDRVLSELQSRNP